MVAMKTYNTKFIYLLFFFMIIRDFYVPQFELEAVTKLHIVTRMRKPCVQDFRPNCSVGKKQSTFAQIRSL